MSGRGGRRYSNDLNYLEPTTRRHARLIMNEFALGDSDDDDEEDAHVEDTLVELLEAFARQVRQVSR